MSVCALVCGKSICVLARASLFLCVCVCVCVCVSLCLSVLTALGEVGEQLEDGVLQLVARRRAQQVADADRDLAVTQLVSPRLCPSKDPLNHLITRKHSTLAPGRQKVDPRPGFCGTTCLCF